VAKTTSGFNSNHTIRQYSHGLLLESLFVPSSDILFLSGAVDWRSRISSENWPKLGGFGPPNFNGGLAPKFRTNIIKLHLYPTFWAIKVPCR